MLELTSALADHSLITSGSTDRVVLLSQAGLSDYTAIAHGGANGYDLSLEALLDDNNAPAAGNGKVRFGHLAPFDPVLANTAADIRTDDGSLVLGHDNPEVCNKLDRIFYLPYPGFHF